MCTVFHYGNVLKILADVMNTYVVIMTLGFVGRRQFMNVTENTNKKMLEGLITLYTVITLNKGLCWFYILKWYEIKLFWWQNYYMSLFYLVQNLLKIFFIENTLFYREYYFDTLLWKKAWPDPRVVVTIHFANADNSTIQYVWVVLHYDYLLRCSSTYEY